MKSPSAVRRGGCGKKVAGKLSQEGAGEYRLALLGLLPSHPDSSPLSHLTARWLPHNPPQRRSAGRAGVDLRPMLVVQLSLRWLYDLLWAPLRFFMTSGLALQTLLLRPTHVSLQTTTGLSFVFGRPGLTTQVGIQTCISSLTSLAMHSPFFCPLFDTLSYLVRWHGPALHRVFRLLFWHDTALCECFLPFLSWYRRVRVPNLLFFLFGIAVKAFLFSGSHHLSLSRATEASSTVVSRLLVSRGFHNPAPWVAARTSDIIESSTTI